MGSGKRLIAEDFAAEYICRRLRGTILGVLEVPDVKKYPKISFVSIVVLKVLVPFFLKVNASVK